MRMTILAFLAVLGAQTAQASETTALIKSSIFVERGAYNGRPGARTVERASTLGSGDRVVTILDWRTHGEKRAATVSLSIPTHLAFQRSSLGNEEISIDQGRSWGRLGTLRMRDSDGPRLAVPEDVTNVRWRVNGTNGRITYSAVVR